MRPLLLLLLLACAPPKPSSEVEIADTSDPSEPSEATSWIDPACPDGAYAETLPTAEEDLSDLLEGFDEADPETLIGDMLSRRYPFGAWALERAPPVSGDTCAGTFLSIMGPSFVATPQVMSLAATILVHECGHLVDASAEEGGGRWLQLTVDLGLAASGAGAPPSPARSQILADAYASQRPPCADDATAGDACDSYADTYLSGDPDDDVFDSGDQGLDLVAEELLQYTHSLATALALQDLAPRSSYRDGVLTFLWYTERLLALWRAEDPDGWRLAMDEGANAELLLTLWGQAWLYLDATAALPLGVNDAAIAPLVLDPTLLAEIDALRAVVGCR